MNKPALFLLFCFFTLPYVLRAQTSLKGSLNDVAFIEGHWKARTESNDLEAVWSAPAGDNITGFIRMMKDGRITLYELFGFEKTEQGPVVLVKHFKPGLIGMEEKEQPDRYRFVEAGKGRAIFEKQGKPQDEPLRVLYEKRSSDQFVIALGKQQAGTWEFKDLFTFNRVK